MSLPTNIPTEKEMIEELQNAGISVKPVLKAFVPMEFGYQNSVGCEEMNIYEAYLAYLKLKNSFARHYDPFS